MPRIIKAKHKVPCPECTRRIEKGETLALDTSTGAPEWMHTRCWSRRNPGADWTEPVWVPGARFRGDTPTS